MNAAMSFPMAISFMPMPMYQQGYIFLDVPIIRGNA
jgi:hypothetical protein